mmetsp:Transcript_25767/g.60408  ORF Transcript_25767/g.60408 Transcript_25767/m.60408 type:complete len:130 (-) Transcript_25767:187-576(-)|eukprot:CAMPEP_0197184590 /NCGR_PEP_ID=MMETSP1423-20130617/10166_1 /TAXON_ID=476441 /ORGANISM="Pseudo-nitzschia heimii, Strain UNC1101" /LENGTH=129 /DNA_ID=CAMNT_0042635441 /DNA_START=41 /DNA_END=430 /DNA_ORIENTATION=-
MSDDNKNPEDEFKKLIKIGVNAANTGLRLAQTTFHNYKEPLSSTLQTIEDNGAVAIVTAKNVYTKRKQYAPQIMLGTALTSGGYLWLRRGRIAGIIGATLGSGMAYSIVYDEFPFDLENFPNMIFGKKE